MSLERKNMPDPKQMRKATEAVNVRIADLEARLKKAKAQDKPKEIYIDALESNIERSKRELTLFSMGFYG